MTACERRPAKVKRQASHAADIDDGPALPDFWVIDPESGQLEAH